MSPTSDSLLTPVAAKARIGRGVGDVLMAAVVSARLIPWEPDVPGIAYTLEDGTENCVAGLFASTIPGLIQKLSFVDRREFEEQMSDV